VLLAQLTTMVIRLREAFSQLFESSRKFDGVKQL